MKHKREFQDKLPELVADGLEVSILASTAFLPKVFILKKNPKTSFDFSISAIDQDNLIRITLFFQKEFQLFLKKNSIDEIAFSDFLIGSLHITELYFGLNFKSISSKGYKDVPVREYFIDIEYNKIVFNFKISVF